MASAGVGDDRAHELKVQIHPGAAADDRRAAAQDRDDAEQERG
ncbi:hypothetical protein O982_24720 [Mycobacterium avium 10-5581]|nr:hypothetical protein O982_24720 [Mycobacterium avium 10-5581]